MDTTSLGTRQKEFYEQRGRTYLTRRVPVIMRVDMKAGHTYTKGLDKPFDEGYVSDMNATAMYLVENIQGAKCAYVQSDEISILITDYDKLTTDAWFNYQVQKMCSVGGSMASVGFNRACIQRSFSISNFQSAGDMQSGLERLVNIKWANFDARVFNLPKEEVNNCFIWRQRDCIKNSVSMTAQAEFSAKQLHKKNTTQQKEMLLLDKDINWDDLDSHLKRGRFISKLEQTDEDYQKYVNQVMNKNPKATQPNRKSVWKIWETTPDFTKNTKIINNLI